MTGFERFQQKVKDGILAYLPKEYRGAEVDIIHVRRNNDQKGVAMAIKREGQSTPARIYLEEYYNRFPDWASDKAILQAVAAGYLAEESEMGWKAEMAEAIKDFGSIKGNIRVQVVNRDMNREGLRGCPKKEVEGTDLVAVFQIILYKEGEEHGSVKVTDRMMEGWGIDMESLYLLVGGVVPHQDVGDVPGVHLRPLHIVLVDGVNHRLEQVVAGALLRILEVQADDLIAQLLQIVRRVVVQLCLGVADDQALPGQRYGADGLDDQATGLAGAGGADSQGVGVVPNQVQLLPVPHLLHPHHDAAFGEEAQK